LLDRARKREGERRRRLQVPPLPPSRGESTQEAKDTDLAPRGKRNRITDRRWHPHTRWARASTSSRWWVVRITDRCTARSGRRRWPSDAPHGGASKTFRCGMFCLRNEMMVSGLDNSAAPCLAAAGKNNILSRLKHSSCRPPRFSLPACRQQIGGGEGATGFSGIPKYSAHLFS